MPFRTALKKRRASGHSRSACDLTALPRRARVCQRRLHQRWARVAPTPRESARQTICRSAQLDWARDPCSQEHGAAAAQANTSESRAKAGISGNLTWLGCHCFLAGGGLILPEADSAAGGADTAPPIASESPWRAWRGAGLQTETVSVSLRFRSLVCSLRVWVRSLHLGTVTRSRLFALLLLALRALWSVAVRL